MSEYSNSNLSRNRAAALAAAIVDTTNESTGDAYKAWFRGDIVKLRDMRAAEIEAALNLVTEYAHELAQDLLREIRSQDD